MRILLFLVYPFVLLTLACNRPVTWWPFGKPGDDAVAASQPSNGPAGNSGQMNVKQASQTVRPPVTQPRGSIEADILIVNDQVVTVAEILYSLREKESASGDGGAGSVEEAHRRVVPRVQQAVGTLLLYQKATAKLQEQALQSIDKAIDAQIKRRASLEFNDSVARFEEHLADHGLSLKQYRESLERQMVARDYVRNMIAPQINVNREELLAEYNRRKSQASGPETRELMMIECPFVEYLPADVSPDSSTPQQRSAAEAQAEKNIRAAYAKLPKQSFESVAAEFDRGLQRSKGGSWGMIGKPLKPPYDDLSRRIFQFREGQCSEPIRTPLGWYIVRCGAIRGGALKGSFDEVQSTVREEMLDQRFAEFTSKYLVNLAQQSAMSSVDDFVSLTVRRYLEQRSAGGRAYGRR